MRTFSILFVASFLLVATNATAGDRHKAFEKPVMHRLLKQQVANPISVQRPIVVAQNNGPTLAQAIETVKRQYKGRIVGAETRMNGNREVHRIRVLTEDGKVKTVTIQGRTLGKGRR